MRKILSILIVISIFVSFAIPISADVDLSGYTVATTIEEKAANLLYFVVKNHSFSDGNKRIALTLGTYFLYKNGHYWAAAQFMQRMEAIIYHIAASNIGDELLLKIMACVVDCLDFDEELKIELIHAMEKTKIADFTEKQ